MTQPTTPAPIPGIAGACLLAQTGVYEEYLSLRPIAALPGSHDVLIQSRLDSATNPQALQTRYRSGLSLEALERFHQFLGDYLDQHRSQKARKSAALTQEQA